MRSTATPSSAGSGKWRRAASASSRGGASARSSTATSSSGRPRRLLEGGYLFHFNLTGNRAKIGVDDPRLNDRVADNLAKHEITESESLLIGRDFGVVTDIETGPDGNLYVVSLSNGAIYEIFRR